jgi:galactokinase/mevalonate kinase-like predicted kinase
MLVCQSAVSLDQFLLNTLNQGFAVACFSDLPAGSGMGGSSILAATILKSVGSLVNIELTHEALIYLVNEVEQLLTTGGGWQDQVGIPTALVLSSELSQV